VSFPYAVAIEMWHGGVKGEIDILDKYETLFPALQAALAIVEHCPYNGVTELDIACVLHEGHIIWREAIHEEK